MPARGALSRIGGTPARRRTGRGFLFVRAGGGFAELTLRRKGKVIDYPGVRGELLEKT